MVDSEQYFDVIEFLPHNFFSKEKNEPFIKEIMSAVLKDTVWIPGNPDNFETDYFCDGIPFEFTLASDSKRKNNFIQRVQRGTYSSEDVEKEAIAYIRDRIADKAAKKYSVSNVHLCVLCLLDMFNWVSDEYGSITHTLTDWRRKQFFDEIKSDYIDTGIFNNIFIIFPDVCAKWWVWDLQSNHKASIQLSDSEINSGKYPYVRIKPSK